MNLDRIKLFSDYHLVNEADDEFPSLDSKSDDKNPGGDSASKDSGEDFPELDSKKDTQTEAPKKEDSKGKEKPTVKYKENMGLGSIESVESSYRTYMAMFSEAINCLDAIASLCTAQNPEAEAVKSYQKSRSQIGLKIEKSEAGVKSAWSEIANIAGKWPNSAGGSGLTSVVPTAVKQNDVFKKYDEEKKALDAQLKGEGGRKLSQKYYDTQLADIKKKYSAMIDPAQIESMVKINDAIGLYRNAIDKFTQGANIELDYVNKKEDLNTQEFYDKLADSMEALVLSKTYSSKNSKSFESVDYSKDSILEDLGGFLHQNKPFVDGVAQGVKNLFKGNKETPLGKTDASSLYYAAENLKGAVMSAASEIDNVINFKKSLYGTEGNGDSATEKSVGLSAEEAKSSASEMISFLRDSFKYLVNIQEEIKQNPPSQIKSKLDAIEKQLTIIGRKDGPMDKWKNEVMGEQRERVASSGYLQKGRELMQMASDKTAEVTKQSELKQQIRNREGDVLLKKAIDSVKGKPAEQAKLPKRPKRSDIPVFSKNSKDPDKSLIKSYQDRLIALGKLPSGHSGGEYDKETQDATKKAMTHLGTITGKVYNDSDEAFQDFQRDLGFYTDNKDEIKKLLGY